MKNLLIIIFYMLPALNAGAQATDTVTIHFPFDRYHLTDAAKSALDNFIANYKRDNTQSSLQILGHCDYIGSHSYNEILSKKRSATVKEYLLNNGMNTASIQMVEGYGERVPVNDNNTAFGRQQNRRVEIIWNKPEEKKVPPTTPDPVIPEPAPQKKDTVPFFSRTTIDTMKTGQVMRLRNINFYGGRHTFLPQSMPALQELLDVTKEYPNLEIEIQGHICCRNGSPGDGLDYDAGDDRLSYNRARAVYYFLANNGINKRRMTFRGFGGEFPLIVPERTEEDRTLNRRVEIKITKK